jgi:hypothetical protein
MKIFYMISKPPLVLINIGRIVDFNFFRREIVFRDSTYQITIRSKDPFRTPRSLVEQVPRNLLAYGILMFLSTD